MIRAEGGTHHYTINLPKKEGINDVLRWDVETKLEMPEQRGVEFLFPSITGGFR